ncbi:hypothetical protein [Streptomonospora arabica]|uniref:Uncharacterized protein n=1 Tax=Streptomonospora arabica TaxID=412417 RepID=A0ABV9SKA7_9ACTN
MEWGSFLAGAGTALAAVVAALAFANQVLGYRLERRREDREVKDRAQEEADRRQAEDELQRRQLAQASLVRARASFNGGSIDIRFVNDGERPVQHLELTDLRRQGGESSETWTPNPNTTPVTRPRADVLSPHGEGHRFFAWLRDAERNHITGWVTSLAALGFRFMDADGQWWYRDGDGTPQRIDPPNTE